MSQSELEALGKKAFLEQFPESLIAPLDGFLRQLKVERNYSQLTTKNYARQLIKLLEFIQCNNLTQWQQLKPIHIRQLSAQNHRLGLSAKSIALLLSACRQFFQYLIEQEQLQFNPAKGIKAPKLKKRLPKTVDVDQLTALLDGIDVSEDIGIRDKAVAELFYSSGIRLAELVRLNLKDLDLPSSEARITGKGSKTRIVPIGKVALKAIQEWIKVRSVWLGCVQDNDVADALFISQRKSRLTPRSIQARMAHWGQVVGLNGRLHPHRFRHSCATHILESSGDLRAVQELLGHADLSTTQIYTHLDFQKLAAVYDQAHPRAKK